MTSELEKFVTCHVEAVLKEYREYGGQFDDDEDDGMCPDKMDPPFKVHDNVDTSFEVFKTSPEYKMGSVQDIDLNDPMLFATQDHICLGKMKEYQNTEWPELPVVISFDNDMKFIQDGHHKLSARKLSGENTSKAYVIPRTDSAAAIAEHVLNR